MFVAVKSETLADCMMPRPEGGGGDVTLPFKLVGLGLLLSLAESNLRLVAS